MRFCEYAIPIVPFGKELVVMFTVVPLIVIVKAAVAVALELSVTLQVTEVGPQAVVGVPLITPMELSASPVGKVPEAIDHV